MLILFQKILRMSWSSNPNVGGNLFPSEVSVEELPFRQCLQQLFSKIYKAHQSPNLRREASRSLARESGSSRGTCLEDPDDSS